MARTWLSIRVELVEGGGRDLWPRPGRVFLAARWHTFADLAVAIDAAFARWDLSHLHAFEMADGARIGPADDDDDEELLDESKITLSRLADGERFVYVFDVGEDWAHLCTVTDAPKEPEMDGRPDEPLLAWGWGDIPDQYGRRWELDDGERPPPEDPRKSDLPPLRPDWGPGAPYDG